MGVLHIQVAGLAFSFFFASFIWLASVSNNLQLKNGIVLFVPRTKGLLPALRQAHGREEGSRMFDFTTISRIPRVYSRSLVATEISIIITCVVDVARLSTVTVDRGIEFKR